MVDDSPKGASFGQKNSLMHHNQIINSSIIINIIVNGKNRTRDLRDSDYMNIYDDAINQNLVDRGFKVDPRFNVDPRYNVEVQQVAQPYQKPDMGLVRIFDHPKILNTDSTPEP